MADIWKDKDSGKQYLDRYSSVYRPISWPILSASPSAVSAALSPTAATSKRPPRASPCQRRREGQGAVRSRPRRHDQVMKIATEAVRSMKSHGSKVRGWLRNNRPDTWLATQGVKLAASCGQAKQICDRYCRRAGVSRDRRTPETTCGQFAACPIHGVAVHWHYRPDGR